MPGDRIFKFSSEKDSFHPSLFSRRHLGVGGEDWPESPTSTDSGDTTDEENEDFWETQHHLLDVILSGTSSTESTILKATEEAVRDSQMEENVCVCSWRYVPHGCQSCFRRDISKRLRIAGFDCATCLSMWCSSSEIPSGVHSYLDVVEKSEKEKEVRVVIELNFRAEFEMARASNEYKRLMNRIPEIFVGKEERLRSLVEILCLATKKSMEENRMHMGPWRKHKYMQAKWFGTCEQDDSMGGDTTTAAGRGGQASYGLRANIWLA
ncbi:uncharacterized protein LOC122093352 [Macadamia integrifolia]|uniref:uncharacterized protein LOC122093352 n=1 Tax=Macadamia integrifolia TaxID=60698 RepID=UPI001C5322A7|nr:uncharacterized protein LOC122093352 [Macadamia integrifolia]